MTDEILIKGVSDKKVILISIDGMRPDGLKQCGFEELRELEEKCLYTYDARTVFPSVTLPCHFSMMHSVTPQRHGILTNTYVPQVRPVDGIFEKAKNAGLFNAMFYGWEELRDVAVPASFKITSYVNAFAMERTDVVLTEKAIDTIEKFSPDLLFLYMVETDEKGGHGSGWMSDEYLRRVKTAISCAKTVIDKFGDRYSVIITADHGGHERTHGTDLPEDMTIPMFFYGKNFEGGKVLHGVSLLDIAPTIARLLDIRPDTEWEGKSLI